MSDQTMREMARAHHRLENDLRAVQDHLCKDWHRDLKREADDMRDRAFLRFGRDVQRPVAALLTPLAGTPSGEAELRRLADAEDAAGSISVGGLAVDAGLYPTPVAGEEGEGPLPWEADEGAGDEDPVVEPLMRALSEVADRGSYGLTRDAVIEAVAMLRTPSPVQREPSIGDVALATVREHGPEVAERLRSFRPALAECEPGMCRCRFCTMDEAANLLELLASPAPVSPESEREGGRHFYAIEGWREMSTLMLDEWPSRYEALQERRTPVTLIAGHVGRDVSPPEPAPVPAPSETRTERIREQQRDDAGEVTAVMASRGFDAEGFKRAAKDAPPPPAKQRPPSGDQWIGGAAPVGEGEQLREQAIAELNVLLESPDAHPQSEHAARLALAALTTPAGTQPDADFALFTAGYRAQAVGYGLAEAWREYTLRNRAAGTQPEDAPSMASLTGMREGVSLPGGRDSVEHVRHLRDAGTQGTGEAEVSREEWKPVQVRPLGSDIEYTWFQCPRCQTASLTGYCGACNLIAAAIAPATPSTPADAVSATNDCDPGCTLSAPHHGPCNCYTVESADAVPEEGEGQAVENAELRNSDRTPSMPEQLSSSPTAPFRLVLRDAAHATHALTNGRVRLSVWAGELDASELEALDAQLRRGASTPSDTERALREAALYFVPDDFEDLNPEWRSCECSACTQYRFIRGVGAIIATASSEVTVRLATRNREEGE